MKISILLTICLFFTTALLGCKSDASKTNNDPNEETRQPDSANTDMPEIVNLPELTPSLPNDESTDDVPAISPQETNDDQNTIIKPDNTKDPAVSPEPENPTPPISDSNNNDFGDIKVPDDFDLNTSYDMNIKINLTTKKTLNLTIYHDFTEFENGEISPIAGSLLVSGTMLNGNFNGTIRVTSVMIYILIQAYDNNANQMFYQAVVEATPDGIIITD